MIIYVILGFFLYVTQKYPVYHSFSIHFISNF